MDLTMRLQRVMTADYPILVAAIAAAENALTDMERAQKERFNKVVRGNYSKKKPTPEQERGPRHFNIKAVRRDWDLFKAAMDAHVAKEIATFVPLARKIASLEAGHSTEMMQLIEALDAEHQELRELAQKIRTHALSIAPIRESLNGATSALKVHIRMHDIELTPQLNQGTIRGADRRDSEDRYRHSNSIRASARPAPDREEEPKKGLLDRWFSMIRKQR